MLFSSRTSASCCIAARRRHTKQPPKAFGSSPMVDAMAYSVRRSPPHERVRWDGTTASATRSGFATTPLASGACGWALPMTRRRGRAMSSEHPHPGLRPHLDDVRGCLPLDRPRARRFRVQILRKYGCALGHAASLARVTYARTRTPGRPAAALAPHLPGAARLRREIEAQLAAYAAMGLPRIWT